MSHLEQHDDDPYSDDENGDPKHAWVVHIAPTGDIMAHTFSESCLCKPFYNDEGALVHYAFDGRHLYETERRKHN